MVLLPRPVMVGDMYWMTFDDRQVRFGSLFARCLRCRLVREDTFETGFRFMHDIDLKSGLFAQQETLV